jgi:hypothetical protein
MDEREATLRKFLMSRLQRSTLFLNDNPALRVYEKILSRARKQADTPNFKASAAFDSIDRGSAWSRARLSIFSHREKDTT